MDMNGLNRSTFSDCSLLLWILLNESVPTKCLIPWWLLFILHYMCTVNYFSGPPWCHHILWLADLRHEAYIRVEGLKQEMLDVLVHWENLKPVERENDRKQFSEKDEGKGTVQDAGKDSWSEVWGGDRRQRKKMKREQRGKQIGVQHSRSPAWISKPLNDAALA